MERTQPFAVVLDGRAAERQPVRIGNIHCLAAVEPVAETGVKCCRERNNELARPLHCRHNSHTCGGKQQRNSGGAAYDARCARFAPCSVHAAGEINVVRRCSRSGACPEKEWREQRGDAWMTHANVRTSWNRRGTAFRSVRSKRPAEEPGIPYQLLGAPWCKKLMLYRLWSSLCQQNEAKSMPMYSHGLQMVERS